MENHFLSVVRKYVLFTLLTGLCASAFAQQKISGIIVDVSGQPVIGAGVVVKGTTVGSTTNIDGAFQLTVPENSTLVASCIGYVDQTFTVVSGKNSYHITLSENSEMLDETVVIGYGAVRVKDLTGSVASVSSKDLSIPVSNVAQALQGKMAGVVVTLGNSPGAAPQIRVRGTKSITQSNDPLVIVDGFPSSLANVPADQIKSINVLKDAAATAIYGSRGASGVILVTTKNAIEGQTNVSYSGYVQVKDSKSEMIKTMDTMDYLKFTLGYSRDYNTTNYVNLLSYFGIGPDYGNHGNEYKNVQAHNWQNDIYKTAITHSHNLTVSTGTKKIKSILSLNYVYDDGTVINSWYNRINGSLKNQLNLNDNLSLDLNLVYYMSSSRGNGATGYEYKPITNPLGDSTNLSGFGNGSGYIEWTGDPVESSYNREDQSVSKNFRAVAAVNWKPFKGMTFRSELGLNNGFVNSESYSKGWGNNKKSAGVASSQNKNLHWSTTAQYQIPFTNDIHRADIMIGNEVITSDGSGMSISAYEYPENFDRAKALAFINQYTEDFSFSTSYNTPGRSISWFARANYSLYDRYMLTATFRADGSSKFAPNNRWGFFPAAAFAWRAIDEEFMSGTKDWLSNLKVRLSYGLSGSDSINANLWKETWNLGGDSAATISSQRTNTELDYFQAYAPGSQMMNPDLKWETTATTNLGIDFGMFKERLYGSIEGYYIKTYDLLMPVTVNSSTGYSTQYQNMGSTSNRGLELTLAGDIVRNSEFTLNASLVFQYNINKIDALANTVKVVNYGSWAGSSETRPTGGEYYREVGSAMGMIRGYHYLGWYTTDDFNYDSATGVYTLKDGVPDWGEDSYWTSFKLPKGQAAFPGAMKLEDINGDGVITTADTYNIGEVRPRASGSFNLQARWRDFDLGASFNYTIGGKIINCNALRSSYGSKDNRFGANRLAIVGSAYSPYRWTSGGELEFVSDPDQLDEMNANAKLHTPTSMVGMLTDNWVEDGSFLRLRDLTVGYNIPKKLIGKAGIKNARVYFTGTNIFTLSRYSGLDPEVSQSDTTPGQDNSSYPLARTYTFGLNITF